MSNRQHASSMFQRFIACTCSALIAMTSIVPAFGSGFDTEPGHESNKERSDSRGKAPALRISSPQRGSVLTAQAIPVEIEVGTQENPDSLKVRLNGKDISNRISAKSCNDRGCKLSGSISESDGVTEGANLLIAMADAKKNVRGSVEVQRTEFHYRSSNSSLGSASSPQAEYYTPASVGLDTNVDQSTGDITITLTTGNQSADDVSKYPILNNASGYTQIPYPDKVITTNCGSNTYWAVVLNREAPAQDPIASMCINSESDMESTFSSQKGRSLGDDDLVLFGTTNGKPATKELNTTSIGGTDYTKLSGSSSNLFPLYYNIIGVKGAAAGTAHETSSTPISAQTPYNYQPLLNGVLTEDENLHYNYIPESEVDFKVISNGTNSSVTLTKLNPKSVSATTQTYTPPQNGGGLFWLLVLDRMGLQPVNYQFGIHIDCSSDQAANQCGMLFDAKSDGGESLAQALNSISPRNLIILTTLGCPLTSADQASSDLGTALANIGGTRYALDFLTRASNTCNYSLVTVNDGKHMWFNSNAALSANMFSDQGQTGAIQGYFAPDNSGLFDIAGKAQMTPNTFDTTGDPFLPWVDYRFEHLASQRRQDWNLTDTAGNLAAYHDISNQLLTDPSINEQGSANYDVRYFYDDFPDGIPGKLVGLIDSHLDDSGTKLVTQSSWDTATSAEFIQARHQIEAELKALSAAAGYLTGLDGASGIRGILNNSQTGALALAQDIASDIAADEKQAESKTVDVNPSSWLNLSAAILSDAAIGFSAITFPEASAFLGAMSGALRTGSAAYVPLKLGTSIPGPATPYDISLSNLYAADSTYSHDLLAGYDQSVDNIISDYWKLSAAGQLASTGVDSGWRIGDLQNADKLNDKFINGERMSLWMQTLPQFYGERVANSRNSWDPSTFGTWITYLEKKACYTVYSESASGDVPATSITAYHHVGDNQSNLWDVAFFGQGQQASYSFSGTHDYAMQENLSTMLTTDQTVSSMTGTDQNGLNIPPMLLINFGGINPGPIAVQNNAANDTCDAAPDGSSPTAPTGPSGQIQQ